MRRISFKIPLILIGLFLLSLILVFSRMKDAKSQGTMPGTFALKDQDSATLVGRKVAEGELAVGFGLDSIILTSVESKDSDALKEEIKSNGAILDNNTFVTKKNVWVVTFTGHFTPKRYLMEVKPIYSTMVIYLRAEDGSVLGVEMHGRVNESAVTPYPGMDN